MAEELTRRDVEKIQGIIQEAQKKEIQLTTKLESEYETAKKEFDCETLEDIDSKLDSIDKEISSLEKKIDRKSKTLSEAYDWDI